MIKDIMFKILLLALPAFTKIASNNSDIINELSSLKAECSTHFARNNYKKASAVLTKIIKLEPDDYQNYYQRATASFALTKLDRAAKDFQTALDKNPSFLPSKEFLAKSKLFTCKLEEAKPLLQALIKKSAENKKREYRELLKKVYAVEIHTKSIENISCKRLSLLKKIVDVCQYTPVALKKMAECLVKRKEYSELTKISNSLVKLNSNDMDAYLLLAESYLYTGKTKMATKVAKAALRKDPDNKKLIAIHKKLSRIHSLTSEIKNKAQLKEYGSAVDLSESLLSLLPPNTFASTDAQIDSCEFNLKIMNSEKAIKACSEALKFDDKSTRALKARAEAYMKEKDYEKASMDYQKASRLDPHDPELRQATHSANEKAKQAEMKDYYEILGVSKRANKNDIKKAYRKLALKWHPDRVKKESEKKEAQKKFADINEANKVLMDDNLRRRYDSGENVYKEGSNGPSYNPWGGNAGGGFKFRDANGNVFFMNF